MSKNDQRASVVGGHWTLVLCLCSLHRYRAGDPPVQQRSEVNRLIVSTVCCAARLYFIVLRLTFAVLTTH